MENTIQIFEGEEYQITRLPDNRVLYSGIAESDTEAEETLETYMKLYNFGGIALKLEKL